MYFKWTNGSLPSNSIKLNYTFTFDCQSEHLFIKIKRVLILAHILYWVALQIFIYLVIPSLKTITFVAIYTLSA